MSVGLQSERSLVGCNTTLRRQPMRQECHVMPNLPAKRYRLQRILYRFPVSFRTTSKPLERRDLSVRYMEFDKPHDPFAMALRMGLLPQRHPIEKVIPQLQSDCQLMGYGVDVGMSYGLEKIWPFFSADVPLDEFYALSSMPSHLKRYDAHFRRYGIKGVQLVGLDFRNKTFNIYCAFTHDHPMTLELLTQMLNDLA